MTEGVEPQRFRKKPVASAAMLFDGLNTEAVIDWIEPHFAESNAEERLGLLLKLGGLAAEFDEARLDALGWQRQRNDTPECTDPVEETYRSGGLSSLLSAATLPCWKSKRKLEDINGEFFGPSGAWCENCQERQRRHRAMQDANIARGIILRRITYWRKALRKLEASDD